MKKIKLSYCVLAFVLCFAMTPIAFAQEKDVDFDFVIEAGSLEEAWSKAAAVTQASNEAWQKALAQHAREEAEGLYDYLKVPQILPRSNVTNSYKYTLDFGWPGKGTFGLVFVGDRNRHPTLDYYRWVSRVNQYAFGQTSDESISNAKYNYTFVDAGRTAVAYYNVRFGHKDWSGMWHYIPATVTIEHYAAGGNRYAGVSA